MDNNSQGEDDYEDEDYEDDISEEDQDADEQEEIEILQEEEKEEGKRDPMPPIVVATPGMTTPKKLFMTPLSREIFTLNKTIQMADLIRVFIPYSTKIRRIKFSS